MAQLRKKISSLFISDASEQTRDTSEDPSPRSKSRAFFHSPELPSRGTPRKSPEILSKGPVSIIPNIFDTISEGLRWSASLLHKTSKSTEPLETERYGFETPVRSAKKSRRWSASWSRSTGRSRSSEKGRRSIMSEQDSHLFETPTRTTNHPSCLGVSPEKPPAIKVEIPNADLSARVRNQSSQATNERAPKFPKLGLELSPTFQKQSRVTFDEDTIQHESENYKSHKSTLINPFNITGTRSNERKSPNIENSPPIETAGGERDDRLSLPSYKKRYPSVVRELDNGEPGRNEVSHSSDSIHEETAGRTSPVSVSRSSPNAVPSTAPTVRSRSSWESARAKREKRFQMLPRYDDDEDDYASDSAFDGILPSSPSPYVGGSGHLRYAVEAIDRRSGFAVEVSDDIPSDPISYVESIDSVFDDRRSNPPIYTYTIHERVSQHGCRDKAQELAAIAKLASPLLQLPKPGLDDAYEAAIQAARRNGLENERPSSQFSDNTSDSESIDSCEDVATNYLAHRFRSSSKENKSPSKARQNGHIPENTIMGAGKIQNTSCYVDSGSLTLCVQRMPLTPEPKIRAASLDKSARAYQSV